MKNTILVGSLIAGTMITGGNVLASSQNNLDFSILGSGAEVRSALLHTESSAVSKMIYDLKCGAEGTQKTESKSKDAKCGEGKCGEDTKKDAKQATKEAKTEKSAKDAKDAKSTKTGTESKSKDAKCGEGKCGNG